MRRAVLAGLVALLLLAGTGHAQAPAVTLASVLAWEQPAPDLATASCCHKIYVDAATTGAPLAGVVCTGAASPFTCTAPAPVLPGGPHTIAVTHVTGYGETAKSAALSITVLGAGLAAANLRVVPPPPPPAQTITLAPSGDTTLNIDVPTIHAADPTLNVYTLPDLTVANAILLKFDLAAIPATATIQSATLTLTLVQSDTFLDATYTVTAHRIYRLNPIVAQATGALSDGLTAWTAVAGRTVPLAQNDISPPYDTEILDKTNGPKNWTLTRMVQEWVSGTTPNLGVLLNSDPTVLKDRFRNFASLENSTLAARPTLKVVYTP